MALGPCGAADEPGSKASDDSPRPSKLCDELAQGTDASSDISPADGTPWPSSLITE